MNKINKKTYYFIILFFLLNNCFGENNNLEKTGKDLAKKNISKYYFKNVVGKEKRFILKNKKNVTLSNIFYKVIWNIPASKSKTTLILIKECSNVIIENLFIIQKNKIPVGYNTITFQDCDNVIIKNSFFAGAVINSHVRFDGCSSVIIDKIEISGYDSTGKNKPTCGAGIFVDGGDVKNGILCSPLTPNPRKPKYLEIKNSYFHDYLYGAKKNADAILVHSSPSGYISNCYFINWNKDVADGAIDVSHRRIDLSNNILYVKNNIIINSITKSPGKSNNSNKIIWKNNLFINSFHGDYHYGYINEFKENIWIKINNKHTPFFKLWKFYGPTILSNNIILSKTSFIPYYQNAQLSIDKHTNLITKNNSYLINSLNYMLFGFRKEKISLEEWIDYGNDKNSLFDNKNTTYLDEILAFVKKNEITGKIYKKIFKFCFKY